MKSLLWGNAVGWSLLTMLIFSAGCSSHPAITHFAINNGADSTTSPTITLNNTCTGSPTHYMTSESSGFSGATWQTYSTSLSFTFPAGNGTRTVYFKVKNATGDSGVVSGTITLNEPSSGYVFDCMWPVGYPDGVAVDVADNVYVADNSCIQKFTADGTFLTKWSSIGKYDDSLSRPNDVAVDASDNIVYVVDAGCNRIRKFTADGTFITAWNSCAGGFGAYASAGYGTWDGQFQSPTGVAVDVVGNVYVADTDNHRIQKFTADGTFLTKWGSEWLGFDYNPIGGAVWGSEGSGNGQFNSPRGVAVDSVGNVYVADMYNHRIQKFRPEN